MKKAFLILLCGLMITFLVACSEGAAQPSASQSDVQASDNASLSGTESDLTGGSESSVPTDSQEPSDTDHTDEGQKNSSGNSSGSGCEHEFSAATCETASVCKKCGKKDGKALGHSWSAATCHAPKTCTVCNKAVGSPLMHNFVGGACSLCGLNCQRIFSYIDDDGWINSAIEVVREDGAIDCGFMVKVARNSFQNAVDFRDKYYVQGAEHYKIPENEFIEEIRRFFILPDDRIAALKAESPYSDGEVEWKEGYFYIDAGGRGAERPSSGFEHTLISYVKKSGVLELYFDYQSYTLDMTTFEQTNSHISYYKLVYNYSGTGEYQVNISCPLNGRCIETYDKSLIDSFRLVSVCNTDNIPADAISVK